MSTTKPALASTVEVHPIPHTRTDHVGLPVWEVAGLTISLAIIDRGERRTRIGVRAVQTGPSATAPEDVELVLGAMVAASKAARTEQLVHDAIEAGNEEAEALARAFSEKELLEAIAHAESVGLGDDIPLLRDALERRQDRLTALHVVSGGAA